MVNELCVHLAYRVAIEVGDCAPETRVVNPASAYQPPKVNPVRVGVGRVIAVPPVVKFALVVELPPVAPLYA